jgi:HNH endonuclease
VAKEIELSRGLTTLVDDADFDLLDQYYWYANPSGATAYAIGSLSCRPQTVLGITGRKRRPKGQGSIGKMITMHRFLLGAPDDTEVDHINGNGLDNQRSNLRLASRSENMKNRRVFKNNLLGHKGIHFEKKTGRYAVLIRVCFETLDEALREQERIFQFVHGEYYGDGSTPKS